jgi:hypothetical protein
MGVSSIGGSSIELLSLLSSLGLFDVQVTAHMFATVVGNSLVQRVLGSKFHKTHTFGSTSVSVGKEIHRQHFAESIEERFDVRRLSIVGKARHTHFEFLTILLDGLGLGNGHNGLGEFHRFLLLRLHGFFFGRFFFFFRGRFFHGGLLSHGFLGGLDFFFGRFFFRGRFSFLDRGLLSRGSLLHGLDFFFRGFFFGRGFNFFDGGLLSRGSFLGGLDFFFGRFFLR